MACSCHHACGDCEDEINLTMIIPPSRPVVTREQDSMPHMTYAFNGEIDGVKVRSEQARKGSGLSDFTFEKCDAELDETDCEELVTSTKATTTRKVGRYSTLDSCIRPCDAADALEITESYPSYPASRCSVSRNPSNESPGPRMPPESAVPPYLQFKTMHSKSVSAGRELHQHCVQVIRKRGKSEIQGDSRLARRCEALDAIVGPGDVLAIEGNDANNIGEMNGFFGHVLLVSGAPSCIWAGSVDAFGLETLWPNDVTHLWEVSTVECTRKRKGLFRSKLLLWIDPNSHECNVLGELSQSNVVTLSTPLHEPPEKVRIFCCPSELRANWQSHIMEEALSDLAVILGCWSWSTAIRAYLFSSSIDEKTSLNDVMASWKAEPICTSVIITFWQHYLCALAKQDTHCTAMEYITKYMPLKADRSLPSHLLSTLLECGWTCMSRFPS